MHTWLPDAHSEAPTPTSAMLSGVWLKIGLYALLRFHILTTQCLDSGFSRTMLLSFGLFSMFLAAPFILVQTNLKRLLAYSSLEHVGLICAGIGMNTPATIFGALLHMTVHSLTKSAIFITGGHASQIAGSPRIDRIRGLIRTQPAVGWGLLIGTIAIAGFPPFGVFTSEFLLLTATMKSWPWLAIPLLVGFGVAFAGLFRHVHPMVYGEPPEGQVPVRANMLPVMVHLALVLWLGLSIPSFLARWFEQATVLISGGSPL
jgi:hydrogenase-4 component F